MVQQKPINESFDSSNLLFFLYKWRKPLLWVIAVAIVGSTIVSLLLTNKYRSTVIMYPAATNAISQALLTQNRSSMQKGILDFGVDEETEQILQILHSNRIRDRIIEEFGLEQHYGINPESKYRLNKLHRQYENNISFRRTEFMAIRISVLDTDPNYAADIANRISDLLDSTKSQIQHERAKKAFEIVKSQYFKLADEMQQMEDSLTELRKHGVQDYESQAEMLNMQLAKEMAANNTVGVQRLQEKLDILAQYGGAYVNIRDRLEYEREKLSLL
ncbi:MAG TPA: Wzz/FepE/Etk N-terminal domain-containing protein, partial [Bacteroidales bacterium]|nr:Wzz/FepE/Etk N-terminal domain-containing protein [Bacteroidales bacterium]